MLRLCSCTRLFVGAVRPGDAVQPSIGSLELDEQHRHQLRPPCHQSEWRPPVRGGRGKGRPQPSHHQLSRRTGQCDRDTETTVEGLEVWWAANETARLNPQKVSASELRNRRVVIIAVRSADSALYCSLACFVILYNCEKLDFYLPPTLTINMYFDCTL